MAENDLSTPLMTSHRREIQWIDATHYELQKKRFFYATRLVQKLLDKNKNYIFPKNFIWVFSRTRIEKILAPLKQACWN